MRAVMPTLLPDVMALRKRTGADRWDEIWDGVLHMAPMPNRRFAAGCGRDILSGLKHER